MYVICLVAVRSAFIRTNLSKRSSKGSKCLQSPIVAITCLQITYLLVIDNFVEFVKDFYKIVLKYLFGCFNNFSNQEIVVHDYTEVC